MRLKQRIILGIALVTLIALADFVSPLRILATDYSSSSFKIKDPVIGSGAATFSSSSFGSNATFNQSAIGKSTSTNFQLLGGFQYYFKANPNTLTATAGTGQVSLSWTVPQTFLGITVSGYELGVGTSSGSYTYESVGNVTSFVKTGLTGGTQYFFKIRVLSPGSQFLVFSNEANSTPTAASGGGGGGGGGGAAAPAPTGSASVFLSGRAYPSRVVTVLKDAQVVASTIADSNAAFSVMINGIATGNYIFSIYSEDKDGNRSNLFTFPVSVTAGAVANIGGVFIAPTIDTDKTEVKKGESITIFGQSAPNSEVTISVHSDEEFFNKVKADAGGVYLHNFDTAFLEMGDHLTKSKAALVEDISTYSKAVSFVVGTQNIAKARQQAFNKADLSLDGKVNLVDFSILAYWFNRSSPPTKMDLNGDKKVNLIDLSIMAYHWTG